MAGAVAVPHELLALLPSERPADIVKPLEDQRAAPGEDVVLSCELSQAGTPVRWLKDGKAIRKSQKYELLVEGTRAMLVVHAASLKDSGEYMCETEASKSTASLRVEGNPTRDPGVALVSSGVSWSLAVLSQVGIEGSPSEKGLAQTLRFHRQTGRRTACGGAMPCTPGSSMGSGQASCPAPLAPSPEAANRFTEELADLQLEEKGTAVFMCRTERPAAAVTWRKGLTELRPSGKHTPSQEGLTLRLTISALEKADSDTYTCDIGQARSQARLQVQGEARILLVCTRVSWLWRAGV